MKKLSLALAVIALAGCSSVASQRDLAQNDQWMQVGKMDGMAGYHMKSTPELMRLGNASGDSVAQYQKGFQAGIEDFCQPEKTMMRGMTGKLYKGQCAGTANEDVAVRNWLKGFDQYQSEEQYVGASDNL